MHEKPRAHSGVSMSISSSVLSKVFIGQDVDNSLLSMLSLELRSRYTKSLLDGL